MITAFELELIERAVSAAPPLTGAQLESLRRVLRPQDWVQVTVPAAERDLRRAA